MDNLSKQGVQIDNNGFLLCYLCKREAEDIHHILFECSVAYQVLMSCCTWLGLVTIFPRDSLVHVQHFEACG